MNRRAGLQARLVLLFAGWLSLAGTAAETAGANAVPAAASPSATEAATPPTANAASAADAEELPLLLMSARVDVGFSGGDPSQQGFSIPSVRLSASGHPAPYLSYRLSLAQTREFTSALLPQLIPSEAYVRLESLPRAEARHRRHVSLTLGLFTPSLNPWWSPDLGDVPMPDYHVTHRQMLLFRDIGAEVGFVVVPERLEAAIGAFNGVGIAGLNTNSAKAFTGFVKSTFPVGVLKLVGGAGGYWFQQASPGVSNYKQQWSASVFASLEYPAVGGMLMAEALFGHFDENLRSTAPVGGAATLIFGPEWVKAFARYESLESAPTASRTLKQFQFGPLLCPHPSLKIWGLYQSLDAGTGNLESSGVLRARLNI